MKILHTADWHIGQTFYQYDRTYEHQQFLHWLVNTIKEEDIELLIISGDVFDVANPSATSVKLFYTFLNNAVKAQPGLQIIVTAGNHDSAARLEAPKPLLESSDIHIVGVIERREDGTIDYDKLVIPVKDRKGGIALWCMAIPFLRMGDYPAVAESAALYADGVTALYREAYEYALTRQQPGQGIIAMAHLHTLDAELSDHDKTERLIMGGVELVPAHAFHENILYTALGHIHKAQRIGGKDNIRYSGSPLPMSFSEMNYRHQVVTFDITDGILSHVAMLEIPLTTALLRVPAKPQPIAAVLEALQALPASAAAIHTAPYLEVRVLLEGPEPALRHQVETALAGKHVRLARIDVRYPSADGGETEEATTGTEQLQELSPLDIFKKVYRKDYNNEAPEDLVKLFNQVLQDITTKEH
ncbi:exonuclease SbcCD subunit D [Chitinophaga rhizophila]|uniref:Nuclease SbcCD subunit D n=1 Tax=Chitinophaga rhizophila TaxID=2866212 RepID=A0ABS7GJD4_9BACT|nr:exonuclease SbcCD subunit D C-terminal domain-containing protein [Chitinophaga rhizophila]MBW8687406.1 exonuclease SbcCD subunit D C-terminal domain-containing protein [Chitinophaga rhizophila]